MKVLFINVTDNTVKIMDITDNLDTYYNLINCRCIDIIERKIGNKYYDIVCDDEGLLKDNPKISALDPTGQPMLCGNLVIVRNDGKGNLIGLTNNDLANIWNELATIQTRKYTEPYTVLVCDY